MADVPINIGLPVLITGQSFKVRYRKLPDGVFSGYGTYTDNDITITGLDDCSEYEYEIYVGDEECPHVTGTASTKCYSCPEGISAEIVQNGSIFEIVFTYTPPSPPYPPCGYKIQWTQAGAAGEPNYVTLPVSGEIRLTIPQNIATTVWFYINDCNRLTKCYEADLPPADTVCEPIVITSVTMTQKANPIYWSIRIFFNQSTPRTLSGTISWIQTNALPPGAIPDSGSSTFPFVLSPTTNHTFDVKPTVNPQVELPTYSGTLIDACGITHHWSV